MRPNKDEKIIQGPTKKAEFNLDPKIIEQIDAMASYTKISRDELMTIAMKRFISGHKDYFPPDFKF